MTDLVIPDTAGVDLADIGYADLMRMGQETGVYVVPGRTVVPAADLLGVPFIITAVRYQAPIKDKSRDKGFRDYVSLEAMVADRKTLGDAVSRGRVTRGYGDGMSVVNDVESLPFSPEEPIVINDGSTGIRRQVTAILHTVGLIKVAESVNPGDNAILDLPSNQWGMDRKGKDLPQAWAEGQSWTDSSGLLLPHINRKPDGTPLVIVARRGCRVSQYTNDYGPSVTYYLS